MVSLWPWRGDDSSPESFERALSTLAGKISKNTTHLNSLRQRSRRLKALWTLYAGFAYILCAVILGLVVGWRKWGPLEYSAVAGGPVVIYLVRLSVDTYYNYRISSVTARLDDLQGERDKTIEKLKASTKYNSTQQLLEKYGGFSSQAVSAQGGGKKRRPGNQDNQPSTTTAGGPAAGEKRVSIVPPPTANIPRNRPLTSSSSSPSTPQQQNAGISLQQTPLTPSHQNSLHTHQPPQIIQPDAPEFAPNAFTDPQPAQYAVTPLDTTTNKSHWYDRLLDVLLGDDETLPKNRLALICTHCKLVNGQASPGVKDLADIGRWRCGGCGGWNGEEESAKKMVNEITKQVVQQREINSKKQENMEEKVKTEVEVEDSLEEGSNSDVGEEEIQQFNENVSDEEEQEEGVQDVRQDEDATESSPPPPVKARRGRQTPKGSSRGRKA
ncbi:MAG: hypothetical protein M1823_000526 [Watsoniomyces obsoletus]|nr:MAG: hypothetical protein M1823_000526 [Watsoniomyces obsoletus]